MSAEIKLSGMDDLLAKIEELGKKAGTVENNALKAAAEPVQKTASELVPKSNYSKKHLADNITISKIKSKGGVKYIEIGPTKGDNSEFYYGKFLEWGTSKMQAHPFMQPAYEQNKNTIMEIMKQKLREGLGI